jgi:hypothetical protein
VFFMEFLENLTILQKKYRTEGIFLTDFSIFYILYVIPEGIEYSHKYFSKGIFISLFSR